MRVVAKLKMQDAAILEYVTGKLSLAEVAFKYNTRPSAIRGWITARNLRRVREETARQVDKAEKKDMEAKVFAGLSEGMTIPQIAKKYKISVKKVQLTSSTKAFKGRELRRMEAYVSDSPLHAGDGAGGRMTDEAVRGATKRLGDKIRALQTKLNMPTFHYAGDVQLELPLLEVLT